MSDVSGSTAMVEKRFTPEEVEQLVERTELLLGDKLDVLIQRHHSRPHRLIELLLRMRTAAAQPDSIEAGAAAVNAPELHAYLDLYDAWHASPNWPELQAKLCSPDQFLHTVAMLSIASMLKTRHADTRLVLPSNVPHPDLELTVDATHVLGFEVKAPQSLWQTDHALSREEAKKILEKALWGSYQQLAGGPGLLAVAGFHWSAETFDVLTAAGNVVLGNPRQPRPLLFGMTLHNLGSIAGIDTPGLASIWFAERSRLGRSKFYRGSIDIVGDWSSQWHLAVTQNDGR
jgi:hypothetical protein